jgi:integrase
MTPHLFRDAAATAIAIHDPEHVNNIMPVLGHATLTTSEQHYNQAQGLEAGRRYHGTLAAICARVRLPNKPRRGIPSAEQEAAATDR